MNKKTSWLWMLLLLLNTTACDKDKNPDLPAANRGDLIEAVEKGMLTTSEIVERVDELEAEDFASHDVNYYTITYRTEYMGKPVNSAGLLILPKDIDKLYLIMYCHGTELPSARLGANKITPSFYDGDKETHRDVRNMGLGWASAGYAVFIPDYIGYGLTLGKDHPYVYYPEMFTSDIDGLLAVKQFLHEKSIIYDNRLFLTGWSQGAGAALSTHKYIQEQYADEFTVVATSGLAGPYNFKRFAEDFLNKQSEEIKALPIFSWGLYSLNKFSGLKRPTDQIFTFPVYDQISSILVPSNQPDKTFRKYFLDKWKDGSDIALIEELQNNSFHDGWNPTGKVFLHHGNADDLVPYFNSTDAYQGLTEAGGDIKIYEYPDGKHNTELGKFILNTLTDFNVLR